VEVWPVTLLALVALTACDFMFGKSMKRRWLMTAGFWVLLVVLILTIPTCGGQAQCDGCEANEGPKIPYSF
jgi:hypothetical protein